MTATILPWLGHAHGGEVTRITAIQHTTHERVATWEFIGRVQWRDGTVSEPAYISPNCLCYDETIPGSRERVNYLMKRLNEYLERNGEWHEPKHRRDGRVVHWTPKKPTGRQDILDHV
jgi:hypothetical protein